MMLERLKFFDAINDFLLEELNADKAQQQTTVMVDSILEIVNSIDEDINNGNVVPQLIATKFHTLKSLLLYGDFYYESDICQDIEISLRNNHTVGNIYASYEELIKSLKK